MRVLKIMLKAAAVPLIIIATLAEWIGMLLAGVSGWIFYLASGAIILFSVLGYGLGTLNGGELRSMIIGGLILFAIPHLTALLIGGIGAVNLLLKAFVTS